MKNNNRYLRLMDTCALLYLFSFCLFSTTAYSAEHTKRDQHNGFSIEPVITKSYGSTWYRLQVSEPITSQEDDPLSNAGFTDTVGQSELEYPLDVLIGGIKLKQLFSQQSKHPFSLELYFWKNVSNPDNQMKDSDWFGVKNDSATSLYKFSYTESSSKLDWAGFEINMESYKHRFFQNLISYGIKVSADYAYHRLYGVNGWRKYPNTTKQTLYLPQSIQVLTYKLWHIEPSAYVKFNLMKKSGFLWQTSFSFSPLVIAKDLDDHVLRNKTTETTALGIGFGLANYAAIKLAPSLSLVAILDIRFFRTSGKMTQTYYGDDLGSSNIDETGLILSDIDNVISSFTQQASVSLRYSY